MSRHRLRHRILLTFFAVALVAAGVSTALMLYYAFQARKLTFERAYEAAANYSLDFDQEVAGFNYLLKGLSQSPALKSGDMKAFYDQLVDTPRPSGSWFILQDLERQLANTLRPFGEPTLPRHTSIPNHEEQISRIRNLGWAVSGLLFGPVSGGTTVALSMRINGPDGEMKYFITVAISERRLTEILSERQVPAGWSVGLYDRKMGAIAVMRGSHRGSDIPAPSALNEALADVDSKTTLTGSTEGIDDRGLPVMTMYRRSGSTDWTTGVSVPKSELDAPIYRALWLISLPAIMLLVFGSIAAYTTMRAVERPLQTLSDEYDQANTKVTELSTQLLALQEEERQSIARELHDSTVQHLVSANLGLMRLSGQFKQNSTAFKTCTDIEGSLGNALTELRLFTYLLHPPNLINDGLRSTLQSFACGFADRVGLRRCIVISPKVDEIDQDLQRSVLRVVQEALTNVHRHANASCVTVQAKVAHGHVVVRVRDDGQGMKHFSESLTPHLRLGVGIPGMRARLRQFGGRLTIVSGSTGTTIVAAAPVAGSTKAFKPVSLNMQQI